MGQLNARAAGVADQVDLLNLKILKLERRVQRERLSRLEAEAIAEKGLGALFERQQQLVLLETIATHANQSRSVDDALRFALEAVCRHFSWAFGNAYLLDPASGDLVPASIWHAVDSDFMRPYIEHTLGGRFASGVGLPGRALETSATAFVSDMKHETDIARYRIAQRFGLRAGLAVPVLLGARVVAVLEFFHGDILEPEPQMLLLLGQIGTQLSRVIERSSAEEKLIYDASHDALTGLPNRLLFTDRLERAIAAHQRRTEDGYAVVFIDLDRFKLVNDSLGHAAGDALLVEISARLNRVIASSRDARGNPLVATLARLGGDEFTVLVEAIPGDTEVVEMAQTLLEAVCRPTTIHGQPVYPSASLGIASSTGAYASAIEIMRDADLAMYRAKLEGRSRVKIFDRSLHEAACNKLSLESDLRNALQHREFVLLYQPVVELEAHRLVGFEALVRWKRPDGEMIAPTEFIPLAEETGLIVPIGQWIMEEAFSASARWRRLCGSNPPPTLSVNVSPVQFNQPDFVGQVCKAICSTGVEPADVRLEITETVTVEDDSRTVAVLEQLRAIGVRVSMDDFGTGYSSLSYLHKLPFDALKIDRSFVQSIHDKGAGIVQSIVSLANNLRLEVIAEGPETQEQVDELRRLGCSYAQGYFFFKPMEEAEAIQLLSPGGYQSYLRSPALPLNTLNT